MFIDCLISGHAINLFTIRMVAENNLNVENKEIICQINVLFCEKLLMFCMIYDMVFIEKILSLFEDLVR